MSDASALSPANRRVFERYRLEIPARTYYAGREDGGAILLDVSAVGAAVRMRRRPDIGEDVVIYAEAGIRLAGRVVRWFSSGFAIIFSANAGRLQRILTKLGIAGRTVQATMTPLPGAGPRLRRMDGSVLSGRVTSISVVGVTVESRERPPLGAPMTVGQAEARVTAHHADGFSAEFDAYWDTAEQNARLSPDRLKRR